MFNVYRILIFTMVACLFNATIAAAAVIDDAADLPTQQAQEKQELEEMRRELGNIKSIMNEAQGGMDQLRKTMTQPGRMQEVHVIAKEASIEIAPGITSNLYTYNGQSPGPIVRLIEGQPVKFVVHNQLRSPTSLCLHGMILPHSVAGLPRRDAGLVAPGQTYAFQFIAPPPGTYWFHPQVVHGEQIARGLCGAVVVEPMRVSTNYEQDEVLVLNHVSAANKMFFTVNGKSAPAIPPIEVKQNSRVRLRIINAGDQAVPLYLTGHRFEVVACNGSDPLEPHVFRDTITIQPGDRYDLLFTANNPGVWSLASALPAQTNTDGKFPGGIAVVVRYPDALK